MANNLGMHLLVRARDGVVFDEPISTFSSANKIGKFDVLENHENFISLIGERLTITTAGGQKREFPVPSGILKVRENKIEVFVGVKK